MPAGAVVHDARASRRRAAAWVQRVDSEAADHRGVPPRTSTCRLYSAAAGGDVTTMRSVLRDDVGRAQIAWSEPSMGWQPLHAAAYSGHNVAVQLLIAHGADVNAAAAHSRTTLMCAAEQLGRVGARDPDFERALQGKLACTLALLLAGADPSVRSPRFGTAVELARANYPQIESLLRNPPPGAARARGLVDKALLPGVRLHVCTYGEGVYVRWAKNTIGSNTHTIRFVSGVRDVELKRLNPGEWSVCATDLPLCQARQRLAFALSLLPGAAMCGQYLAADMLSLLGAQLPTPSTKVAERGASEAIHRFALEGTVQGGISGCGVKAAGEQGWLEKKGDHPGAGWKRRWFRLDGDCLRYHERPDAAPKGCISLVGGPSVRLANGMGSFAEIEIVTARRIFRLRTYSESHASAVDWISSLETALPEGVPKE